MDFDSFFRRASGGALLAATLFLSSAASMALEIAAGRLLAPYVGVSLYTWTAIITVVLAGLSVGHWAGGALADRGSAEAGAEEQDAETKSVQAWSAQAWLVAWLLLAAAATTFLSHFILRAVASSVIAAFDPVSAIGVLALLCFFAPSFFAGALSPLLTAMALAEAEASRRGRVLGRMFALGAAGAILGTAGAGLALIPYFGSTTTVAALAAVYALLAAPFLAGWRRGIAGVAALIGLGAAVEGRAFSPCLEESAYYCIRVDDLAAAPPVRVLVLDHLGHGVNDGADPELLHSPYAQLLDELTRRRVAGSALDAYFVGGGALTLPRAWLAAYPQARITVGEIDPRVTAVAQERLWAPTTPRLEVIHRDARLALAALPPERRFDVIVGDAFHDISIPPHLVTDEFNAEIARRLKPGGVYAINVIEATRAPRFLLAFAETLKRRFASVELWLTVDAVRSEAARATWLVLASDQPTGLSEHRATRPPRGAWVRVPTDAMLALWPERFVLTDDHAPVDRLMSHILFDAALSE